MFNKEEEKKVNDVDKKAVVKKTEVSKHTDSITVYVIVLCPGKEGRRKEGRKKIFNTKGNLLSMFFSSSRSNHLSPIV